MANELLCHFLAIERSDIFFKEEETIAEDISEKMDKALVQLREGKPLQYILNKVFFYESEFYVDENVLIPRPETEELVQWVIADFQSESGIAILDIGTGSGCIPISLKKVMPVHDIFGVDVSEKALSIAAKNTEKLGVDIEYSLIDILDESQWDLLDRYDVIISNPPYIPYKEKSLMEENVLAHEPHLALFVEDDNTLIFYEKTAQFAQQKLNENGVLYFECNEYNANDVALLLRGMGFCNIIVKQDLSGKDRMIKASFQ